MNTNTQPRKPQGTPVGGQFAGKTNPESDVELHLPDDTIQLIPVGFPVPPAPTQPQEGRQDISFGDLERTERIKSMQAELADAVDAMSDHEGWQQFLDSMSKFRRYSFGNAMLIAMQKKDATVVAGFNDWKNKHGRTVKKGEKAIWILAPMIKKQRTEKDPDAPETSRLVGFRGVAVFDVSQTEGPPLPEDPHIAISHMAEGEAPEGMVESLSKVIEANGFTISRGTTGDANGFTDFMGHRVVISESSNERQAAKTLAHEAAHIVLGHGERSHEYHTGTGGHRPDMEVEAESVSYIVGKSWGLLEAGDYSFGYIDSWARGDAKKVRATAESVTAAAHVLLADMDAKS